MKLKMDWDNLNIFKIIKDNFLYTKEVRSIRNLCRQYQINCYTINPDGSIDVGGNVNLYSRDLSELPLKFNKVSGDFNCSENKLKSLKGAPSYVSDTFHCNHNQLTSLEGCPEYVGSNFYCERNNLTSLKGCPNYVSGTFYCNSNQLTSLKYLPEYITGNLYCHVNPLEYTKENLEILSRYNYDLAYYKRYRINLYNMIIIAKRINNIESILK